MLISNKLLKSIQAEVKAQESVVKILEKQSTDYNVDNSTVIDQTKNSINFMNDIVNKSKQK